MLKSKKSSWLLEKYTWDDRVLFHETLLTVDIENETVWKWEKVLKLLKKIEGELTAYVKLGGYNNYKCKYNNNEIYFGNGIEEVVFVKYN